MFHTNCSFINIYYSLLDLCYNFFMNAKQFPAVMGLGTLLFGVVFCLILFTTNPASGTFTKISFFISLFFFIWCSVSIASFALKKKITNNEMLYSSVRGSTRQGLFSSLFVMGVLGFASIRLLTWWDVLLLAFSFILLELYFKSNKVSV